MARLATLVFFLLTFSTSRILAQANQSASVSGVVYMSENETAPFATVMIFTEDGTSLKKADATDENGSFKIEGVEIGPSIIKVSFVGYAEYQSDPVMLDAGQNEDIGNIFLGDAIEELGEVVVKAKRPLIEIKPDKTIFNVEGSINAQGGNALELLRKAPGVILDNNENILLLGKSGTIVYIDGKPSPLSPDDLANYLRGLSSTTIDNIEVITNPSSKYEAEGNAGIINIRLKKNQNEGTNVSINAGLAAAKHTSYDAGININNRGKDVNLFGSYNFANNENEQFMDFMRRIGPTLYDQKATIFNDRQSHNIKAGADIFLNEKSTLGVLVNGFVQDGGNTNDSRSDIYFIEATGQIDSILNAGNNITDESDNYSFNINYAFNNKKGKSINVDLDYGLFRNISHSDQPNDYLDGQTGKLDRTISYAVDTDTDIDIYTFKTDLEQPFLEGVLGYGVKIALVQTDNDFTFFNVGENGSQTLDVDRSNRFLYDEQVNAGYVNFQRGNDKWNYQLGLRVEQTNSTGELITMNGAEGQKNKNDYLDFFPSGGLTYTHNPKNSFRLSYSRRLNRPNYQDLNPFEFKLDELAFRRGNPFLNPEYTHNVQIGHTYNYTLNTTLSFSRTNDMITRITDTEDGRQSFLTWENLSLQNAIALTVSYPYSPTEWWSTYFNVTGNYIQNKSKPGDSRFTEDKNVDLEATFVSIFGQNTIQLPKDYSLEISGFYNSPGVWGGNFETDNYWNLDVGILKKFLNDQLSVKVSVSDVFKGQEWHATNQFGQLSLDGRGGYESRRFKVNLSYNFGNDKVKTRRRKTGLEDEKRRAASSGNGPG